MNAIWIALTSLTVAATLILTSCTTMTTSSQPTQKAWSTRQQQVSSLTDWQMNGKIGVQTAEDSGSATINWAQYRQQYTISLSGPLGANGLKLTGQPGRVTMVAANGQETSAASPEELIAKQYGWNLPVSNLQYWVRGIPVPGVPANTQFDSYHRLTDLSQGGSHIQYLSYMNVGGMELPQKIAISSPSIRTKIVIYDWNTNLAH